MKKSITSAVIIASVVSLPLAGCQQNSTQTTSDHKQSITQHNNNKKSNQDSSKKTKSPTTAKHSDNQTTTPSHSNDKTVHIVQDPNSTLVLVNKTHKLPNGFTPKNLVIPDIPFPYKGNYEKMYMRQVAATAIATMFKAAAKDGIMLYGQSGYRSYTTQVGIFNNNVKTEGEAQASIVSAHPGTSEHQTGLAMDISSADIGYQLIQDFGTTKEGKWVAENAHKYGFIIRYPKGKESITKYEYEPWHIRYVGIKAATYIYDHNLTLEQYIEQTSNQ